MRIGLALIAVLLFSALPRRVSNDPSTSTLPPAHFFLYLAPLRGGNCPTRERLSPGAGECGALSAGAYVPGPLEGAVPPLSKRETTERTARGTLDGGDGGAHQSRALSPRQRFEGLKQTAYGVQGADNSVAKVERVHSTTRGRWQQVGSANLPSALDKIRARLLEIPVEDDVSASLDSNEKRSRDTSEGLQHASRLTQSQAARSGLTADQERAIDAVKAGKNIFLTGSAGTGKSYVLKHLIAALKRRHGNNAVHVTASTGAAAVLIGGTTLHAFAGVGLGKEDAATLVKKVYANKLTSHRWQRARALVIDEVSMIDADLFDKIDYVARQLKTPGRPFGGLQIIVCGDFFQLPPVGPGTGGKRFAFQSMAWSETVHETVELRRVMRQGEDKFVRVLNELRWGKVSGASAAALMLCQYQAKDSPQWGDGVELTKLYPYNVNVRAENEKRLLSLPGDIVTYNAQDTVKGRAASRQRLEALGIEKTLQLKVGAQVMCLKNLDVASGLVNGARGIVVGLAANATCDGGKLWPRVKFACGVEQTMTPETWSVLEADSVVAERKQVPLSLAWAVSVHKCQGMTLDRVEASLSQAFDHGMVYVALSRVKSLQGLRLHGFEPSKVTAHPAVVSFYRSLGCKPPMEEDSAAAAAAAAAHNDTLTQASQQKDAALSALTADSRAFAGAPSRPSLAPSQGAAASVSGYGHDMDGARHGKIEGSMREYAQADMLEVPLEALLAASRNDPRMHEAYALASRGALEPDAAAGCGEHDERRSLRGSDARAPGGLLGKQVRDAVLATAAQLENRRHLAARSVAARRGVNEEERTRQAGVYDGANREHSRHAGERREDRDLVLNAQIDAWRQGFSRVRTRHDAVAPAPPPSRLPHTGGADGALQAHESEADVGHGSRGRAESSLQGAGETLSAVAGVLGSSLLHATHSSRPGAQLGSDSSGRDAGVCSWGPSAGLAAARGRAPGGSERRGAISAVSSDAMGSSLVGHASASGGGASLVREQALGRVSGKRPRRMQQASSTSAMGAGAGGVYTGKNEFTPASAIFDVKARQGHHVPKYLSHKDRVRAHADNILTRMRAASSRAPHVARRPVRPASWHS